MLVEILRLSSTISVDKLGLSLVAEACGKLEDGGSVTVDNLWPGELHDVSSLYNNIELFKRTRVQLNRLRNASRVLSRLQFSLATKTEFLERAILPASRYHGLEGFSNEILMRILNVCYENCDSNGGRESIRRLALMNRRFRDLVYSMPTLWSDICCHRYNNSTSERNALSRFNGLPLDVDFNDYTEDRLVKFASQWRKVKVDHHGSDKKKLSLPSNAPLLEELSLHLKAPLDSTILMDCHLPSLRTLSTDGQWIPATIMRQLTSLSLERCYFSSSEQIHDFCDILRLGRELRQLKMKCWFDDQRPFRDVIWPPARADLPHLETLTCGFWLNNWTQEKIDRDAWTQLFRAVASVTHVLAMPNLRSLRLEFSRISDFAALHVEDMFPSHVPSTPFIPKLRDIRFLLESKYISMEPARDFLVRLLRHLPQPQSIELSRLSYVPDKWECPPRSFTAKSELRNCIPDHLHHLASLLAPIERICIDHHDLIQAEALLLAILEEKNVRMQEVIINLAVPRPLDKDKIPYTNSAFYTQQMRGWLEEDFVVEFT